MHTTKLSLIAPLSGVDEAARRLRSIPGVERVDINEAKRLFRIVSERPFAVPDGFAQISAEGGSASGGDAPPAASERCDVMIAGMSCHSCEVKIERAWKQLPGVRKVDVNARTGRGRIVCDGPAPTIADLHGAVRDMGYAVGAPGSVPQTSSKPGRLPPLQLAGLFALVFFLGLALRKAGLLNLGANVPEATSLFSVFLIGLLAASSSCIAVSGGLMLSGVTSFAARNPQASLFKKLQPIALFIAGRLAGYGFFGGLIGLIGKAIAPPPLVTGLITAAVAVFMVVMGLDMLGIAPRWLKHILPRLPKSIAHRVMDAQGGAHPLLPLALGAGTFFLPCGFTQSLQLYALTTGSFWGGASTLAAFALGTAPALFALGWASSALKGRAGRFFLRFSGALVVMLGFWNVQNGLAVAGVSIQLPRFAAAAPAAAASGKLVDGVQVVDIDVSPAGYTPNAFTLTAGVPAKLRLGGRPSGCLSGFVIPKLNIQRTLSAGTVTEIAFTPKDRGTYNFSCAMGMYRGKFTVL